VPIRATQVAWCRRRMALAQSPRGERRHQRADRPQCRQRLNAVHPFVGGIIQITRLVANQRPKTPKLDISEGKALRTAFFARRRRSGSRSRNCARKTEACATKSALSTAS
jgi:hypothetical protein